MFKRHKWDHSRFTASDVPPVCTVCNLQAVSYNYKIGNKPFGWVIDDGTVWGSHVAIRYPRAGWWCSGKPESTEEYRV